jgi:MFS family permease
VVTAKGSDMAQGVALLDDSRGLVGPVSKRIRRRSKMVWGALALLGTAVAFSGVSPSWATLSVGLAFPGAGFLYAGQPLLAVLSLVLFVLSLAIWLGMGALVVPITLWLGTAAIAALMAPDALWTWAAAAAPLATLMLLALRALLARPRLAKQIATARELNMHLSSVAPREVPQSFDIGPPLDDEDLGAMRFMLDLALQPLDRFDGFTTIDQFREAAWRYQLYALTESLAMLRSTRLPAFTGYLEAAQRNAIVKMTDRRVWKYWFWENLWGNGRWNPDPMARENIMITGWYALALALTNSPPETGPSTATARCHSSGTIERRTSTATPKSRMRW